MNTDWVLMLYPRSGLGFKYGLNLMNQTGIVDSDFYYSDNEGHIFVKLIKNVQLEDVTMLYKDYSWSMESQKMTK